MKKVKRILAMLLAMIMVMGMSVTAFAAESLEIKVSGAGESAIFQNAQLIEVDTTTETGWKFSSSEIENEYVKALKVSDTTTTTADQMAIWKLIKKVTDQENVPGMPADIEAATDSQISAALRKIKGLTSGITWNNGKIVTAPGVYYIKANEEGYSYNPMAAYVSFQYNENGVPAEALKSEGVQAKREDTNIEKTNDNGDGDAVTEIGREVTYTIKTIVPFIAYDNDKSYVITDTISGAAYKLTNGKMMVNVKVGEDAVVSREATLNDTGNSFSLNLDEYARNEGRDYAGQDLVITYTATVTDMEVHNNVTTNSGDHSASTNNFLFAGTATLTKTDDAVDAANRKPLANAEFVIEKIKDNVSTFAKFDEIKEGDVVTGYTLTGWVTTKEEATHVKTGTNGTVTVNGLDNSETYKFVEVVAPNGYSINETPAEITWSTKTDEITETVGDVSVTYTKTTATGTASMTDTKLSALPATGGMGTYLFTIIGIVVMAVTAGSFFVSRRKADE